MAEPELVDLVVFMAATVQLAIRASDVHEALRAVAVTSVPGAPSGVLGIVDVRGTLLPVYDLAERFGKSVRRIAPSDYMLLCEAGAVGQVLLRADRVDGIRSVPGSDISVHPATSAEPWCESIVRLADGLAVICDLRAFLALDDVTLLRTLISA